MLSAFLETVWLLSYGAEPRLINLTGTTLAPHRTRSGLESCKLPQWLLVKTAQQYINQNAEHKDRPASLWVTSSGTSKQGAMEWKWSLFWKPALARSSCLLHREDSALSADTNGRQPFFMYHVCQNFWANSATQIQLSLLAPAQTLTDSVSILGLKVLWISYDIYLV